MNLHLVALRSSGPNACIAEFDRGPGRDALITEFYVEERDGIATASSTPDISREFDGTADEQRQIMAAVIAFCRVATS
jgi:hypothetical protein